MKGMKSKRQQCDSERAFLLIYIYAMNKYCAVDLNELKKQFFLLLLFGKIRKQNVFNSFLEIKGLL